MPPKKKAAPRGKKAKAAPAARKPKTKQRAQDRPAVEFKIVQTVEKGPDAAGKGCVGDRMAEEASLLGTQGWEMISVHRSDSPRFELTFLVGCFRREVGGRAASVGKKAPAKAKSSFKCKEYRPDPDPKKGADDFLSLIYADASRMAGKGHELATFFLTADGAMVGLYRNAGKKTP